MMTPQNGSDTMTKEQYEQAVANHPKPDEPKSVAESFPSLPTKPGCFDEQVEERIKAGEFDRRKLASRRRRAWEDAQVPKRHGELRFLAEGAWGNKLAHLQVRLRDGFLAALIGSRGTGKTQLAAQLIYTQLFRSDHPRPLYCRAIEFFMAIRESYSSTRSAPTETEQIEHFRRPDLLVIDDAHERGGSEWEDRLLTYLIDCRYADGSDTLLISNQEQGAFRKSVGPSIWDRLTETGGIIVADWPSFRTPSKVTDADD